MQQDGFRILLLTWGIDIDTLPFNGDDAIKSLREQLLLIGSLMPAAIALLAFWWHYFDQIDFVCWENERDTKHCHDVYSVIPYPNITSANSHYNDSAFVKFVKNIGCCEAFDETRDPVYIFTVLIVSMTTFYKICSFIIYALIAKATLNMDSVEPRKSQNNLNNDNNRKHNGNSFELTCMEVPKENEVKK